VLHNTVEVGFWDSLLLNLLIFGAEPIGEGGKLKIYLDESGRSPILWNGWGCYCEFS